MYRSNDIFIITEEDGTKSVPFFDSGHNDGCEKGFHRAGIFHIDDDVINKPEISLILSQVAVTRCEHNFMDNYFVFLAYSRHFKEVPFAVEAPVYNIICETKDGAVHSFYFKEYEPFRGLD